MFLCRFETTILAANCIETNFINLVKSTYLSKKNKITNKETKSETHRSVVRVVSGHGGGSFSGQFIKLACGDAFVDASTDFLGHQDWVTMLHAKSIAQLLQPRRDLVEMHRFLTPISLHYIHFSDCVCVFLCE